MNKKQLLTSLLILFLLLSPAYASITIYGDATYIPNDEELKATAINSGFIPEDTGDEFIQKKIQAQETVIAWILFEREWKLAVVEQTKKLFKEEDNAELKFPNSFYVDTINGILWNMIANGRTDELNPRGLGLIMKSIAIMDGDWNVNDGRTPLEIAQDYYGEDIELIKEHFPEKYEKLVEMSEDLN